MSRYNRPNDRWQCGLVPLGDTCSAGPTCSGKCPKLAECAPTKEGDRWVCNRSEGRGGPCPDGPDHDGVCCQVKQCRPTRSLRVIRGRWLRGAALVALGAALMLLGAGSRNDLLAPGPLTSHHAQVIARADWSNRCATCHPGANDGPLSWLTAAWDGHGVHDGSDGSVTQSALCLKCHQEMATPGRDPLLAHGLPTEALPAKLRVQTNPVAASIVSLPGVGAPAHGSWNDDPLACAACHQEHHGAGHDLAAITDARCQACHTERFDSFAGSHPDFGLWPITRRTRIKFNHASHSAKHFVKAGRGFDCRSCHLEDATGDLTVRADYGASCGSCHDGDLHKSFEGGVAFLSMPTIDPDAIEAGRWPERGKGDFDGDLPPITKLLLAADDRAAEAMRVLREDFSFFDIDPDDRKQVTAAATIVESLQRLLDDLQEEGHGAVAYRLGKLLGDRASSDADYVARLPVEFVDRIQATWLGGEAPPEPFDAVEDRRTGGGWSVDDDLLTLRYRPTGHDDPLMRAWLDAVVALPDSRSGLREALLAEHARAGAPGLCLDCHSVERTRDGLTINWAGRDRLNEPRGFTKFSHRAHLVQPELADCTHCHTIDPASNPSSAYAGLDPTRSASEFVALTKSQCVACHKPHAAGDSCTQCHSYHVHP